VKERAQVSFCQTCLRPFKRTGPMNRYWHAEPFLKLSIAMGLSVERTKLVLMGEFWGWEPVMVNKHPIALPVKAHTSDMTVKEGNAFLDWLIPWAAEEYGIEIHTPEEWKEAA
jgi:hypothetical protein